MSPPSPSFHPAKAISATLQHKVNVGQVAVTITKDKLELALERYERSMKARQGWLAPFSIWVTITLTLETANFTTSLWTIGPTVWMAMFVILQVATGIWTFASAIRALLTVGIDSEYFIRSICTPDSEKQWPVLERIRKFLHVI